MGMRFCSITPMTRLPMSLALCCSTRRRGRCSTAMIPHVARPECPAIGLIPYCAPRPEQAGSRHVHSDLRMFSRQDVGYATLHYTTQRWPFMLLRFLKDGFDHLIANSRCFREARRKVHLDLFEAILVRGKVSERHAIRPALDAQGLADTKHNRKRASRAYGKHMQRFSKYRKKHAPLVGCIGTRHRRQ